MDAEFQWNEGDAGFTSVPRFDFKSRFVVRTSADTYVVDMTETAQPHGLYAGGVIDFKDDNGDVQMTITTVRETEVTAEIKQDLLKRAAEVYTNALYSSGK